MLYQIIYVTLEEFSAFLCIKAVWGIEENLGYELATVLNSTFFHLIFQHYRNDHLSLYVLVNKQYVEDMEAYKNRITAHVVKAMLG